MSCVALGQWADTCGCCINGPCDVFLLPAQAEMEVLGLRLVAASLPVPHDLCRHFVPWEYMWSHREWPRGAQMVLEVLGVSCSEYVCGGFNAILQC